MKKIISLLNYHRENIHARTVSQIKQLRTRFRTVHRVFLKKKKKTQEVINDFLGRDSHGERIGGKSGKS